MKHVYVGTVVQDLADGRLLEPGAEVDLDTAAAAHPHNRRLVDEGLLLPVHARRRKAAVSTKEDR